MTDTLRLFSLSLMVVLVGCSGGDSTPKSDTDGGGTDSDAGVTSPDASEADASSGEADADPAPSPDVPNQSVMRGADAQDAAMCRDADPAMYVGPYKLQTTCADASAVDMTIEDVWYVDAAFRPRVIDFVDAMESPALLGNVTTNNPDPFWLNAYFYAFCPGPECTSCSGAPPGGIAVDIASDDPDVAWISCYAGINQDEGETEDCVNIHADGTFSPAGCTVSALPL